MLNIIYEDAQMIVCHKPSGLAVQNASFEKKDLESIVRNYLAEKNGNGVPYLGVIHRLDQPVQGLTVFAKDSKSAASLSAQVQDGRMKKYYLAVTSAVPEKKEADLEHYLKKDGRTNTSSVVNKGVAGGKKAILHYRVLEESENCALMEIELFTGRHHQIRVQMAAAGAPLLGDHKYNPKGDEHNMIGLCANRLVLIHPKNGKKMEFSCDAQGSVFEIFSSKS